mmetsp:Transcript_61287/g.115393  ORF Transcript_61287/g.115393 Transcript_61287/m.115393 type:complete len:239 (-) Transcript_61287:210-926(-)
MALLRNLISSLSRMSQFPSASRAASAANRWSGNSDIKIDEISLRIPSYGGKISLGSLANIKPAPHGAPGFQLNLYDTEISDSFKKSLAIAVKPLNLKVSFQAGVILLVPKEGTNVSWKRLRSSQSRKISDAYRGDIFAFDNDDLLTPSSNKLSKKLAKAWTPVDTHRKKQKPLLLREQRVHDLADSMNDLGLSSSLAGHFFYERLATSNKKTMRQLIKRVSEFEFAKELGFEKKPALE